MIAAMLGVFYHLVAQPGLEPLSEVIRAIVEVPCNMRDHALVVAYIAILVLFVGLLPTEVLVVGIALVCLGVAICLTLRIIATLRNKPAPLIKGRREQAADASLVSIVVACANEPYAMVNDTLATLARLDYPAYEVIVIDNNNTNVENYQQIKEFCQQLGDNFHFYHFDHVSGFKAGALNKAMHYLHKKSQFVAIVDSDYHVHADFLHKLIPYFQDPSVGIVQAPQDYAHTAHNGLYFDFRAFFSVFLNFAEATDSVTFTGTMGILRRDMFLHEHLQWNEWCITEDTEASIFIHSRGYKGHYVDTAFGEGLMPLTYSSLIKQRARWSYGNAQILRKDLVPILRNPDFSWRQRLSFITQLTAWFTFALVLTLGIVAACVNFLIFNNPLAQVGAELLLITIALSIVVTGIFYLVGLRYDNATVVTRLKAMVAHYGVLFTMSFSWLYCILGGQLGFRITNKARHIRPRRDLRALSEYLMPVTLLLAALIMSRVWPHMNVLWLLPLLTTALFSLAGIFYLSKQFRA